MSAPHYQKLAVIFGSNYYGQNELHGCINDANDVKNFLLTRRGFDDSNVLTLYDKEMTRRNMLKALTDLAAQTHAIAKRNEIPAAFLYYSGHGVQVPDPNNIESSKAAEALVPWDFEKADLLLDQELFTHFIKRLNPATELFIFTDCCNSGTNFNLEYNGMARAYRDNDVDSRVIGLSGCSDIQTSAEVNGHGIATAAFIKAMEKPEKIAAIDNFRKVMADVSISGHRQTPQVSVSNAKLLHGRLFDWLLVDEGTKQISQKELQQLAKQHKRKLFIEWVGRGFRQLTGQHA
jgi:hypothetical protein